MDKDLSSPNQRRSGQALVEAVVALSALTISYLGILSLLNRSVGTSRVIADQNIAAYLSMEGMEIVKNLVDANFMRGEPFDKDFGSGNSSYEVSYSTELEEDDPGADPDNFNPGRLVNPSRACPQGPCSLRYDPALGYNYTTGAPTPFFRVIEIDSSPGVPASAAFRVTSRVYWITKGGGTSEVRLQNYFFRKS